mgnify:CR=1 FL=1
MSFEIMVGAWENEDRYRFPRGIVRQRFSKHIVSENENGWWRLAFAGGPGHSEVNPGKSRLPTGFVVHNPPDYLEFWEIIAGILRDFPCVLYWPGGGAVIGSLGTLQHLPKDMVETLGIPWVSTDPERIRQYVWDNS